MQGLTRFNYTNDIFSTSQRAVTFFHDKVKIGLNEVILEYIYDPCLLERGHSVRGDGAKSFYLSRSVSSQLSIILRRQFVTSPLQTVIDNHKSLIKSVVSSATVESIERAAEQGMPSALSHYAELFFQGRKEIKKDIFKALEMCKDAADLGNTLANRAFCGYLCEYAFMVAKGKEGVEKDIIKAIEIMREADSRDSIYSHTLSILLTDYARMLRVGTKEIKKDFSQAIKNCTEAAELGNMDAVRNLPFYLRGYAQTFFQSSPLKAIEIMEEAIKVMKEMWRANRMMTNGHLDELFTVYCYMLHSYATSLYYGKEGDQKNIPKALEIMKKAVVLGDEAAKKDLPLMVSHYAIYLYYGIITRSS